MKNTIAFMILFFCMSSFASAQPKPDDLYQYQYANELNNYLHSKLKGCNIISPEDYGDENLHFNPQKMVIGDFDGNGYIDICLIIKCASSEFKVISFHKSKNGFKHFVLENLENMKRTRSTLRIEGPGMVVISMADENEKKIKITTVAIGIQWLETCHDEIYIWDKTKFISYYRGV